MLTAGAGLYYIHVDLLASLDLDLHTLYCYFFLQRTGAKTRDPSSVTETHLVFLRAAAQRAQERQLLPTLAIAERAEP